MTKILLICLVMLVGTIRLFSESTRPKNTSDIITSSANERNNLHLSIPDSVKLGSVEAEEVLRQYLLKKQQLISGDQVFVQLDRNLYRPGDTLFFQSYIRDRFTGVVESKSASLYVLLYNERKILADSSRFRISNSTAPGWLVIPIKSEAGKYHLVAFTGNMQNGDPAEAFQTDLYVMEKTLVDGHHQKVGSDVANSTDKPLPIPSSNSTTLTILPVNSRSFAVEIQSADYPGENVFVSGTMNLNQIFLKELVLKKKQRMVINTDELPAGMIVITLFDKALKPLSEIIHFVNKDQRLFYKIQTDKLIYHPGEEAELTVSVTDGSGNPAKGFFSISVTDSLNGIASDLFAPGIEYTYLYHPIFAGNLPLDILRKGVENFTDPDLNLLLKEYGRSTINWDFNDKTIPLPKHYNYDQLMIKVLFPLMNRKTSRNLDLVSLEGPTILKLKSNQNGEISLPLDTLPENTRSVVIMPDVTNKKIAVGSMLSIPSNEQYFKSQKLFINQPFIPNIPVHEERLSPSDTTIPMDKNRILLSEVTITGNSTRKIEYHDQYEEKYQSANVKSLDSEVLWSSTSLEDAIRKIISPYSITTSAIYLHPTLSLTHGPVPVLFVLDGMPIYADGWSTVNTILPSEITSLTILVGKQGFNTYGEAAQGGVIFVNTKGGNPNLMKLRTKWLTQNSQDKMLLPIEIFRPTIEFFNPTKTELEIDPSLQSRSTIFWNPEVYFDGKEPVKIKFTNLNRSGRVFINIQGASVNNLVGSGKAGYLVK